MTEPRQRLFTSYKTFLVVLLFLSLSGFHTPIQAGMIIDLQFTANTGQGTAVNASGAAVIGSAGDQWNHILLGPGSNSGIALTDNAGSATGVFFSYSGSGGYNIGNVSGTVSQTPNPALTTQYLYGGGAIPMTISGLTAGELYDLYVYSSADPAASGGPPYTRPIYISANGSPAVYVTADPTVATFTAGINYAEFAVEADSSGNFAVIATSAGSEVDINGFQLTPAAVPEPSSLILVLVPAVVGLIVYFWRRRRLAAE